MEDTYSNKTRTFLFLIILAIIAFMAFSYATNEMKVYNINYNSHSVEKHGSEALIVRSCLDNFGGIRMFYNPKTNRTAEICFLENGKYGIQIAEEKNEITSFIKNKMQTLKQVVRYVKNTGYTNQIY